MNINSIVELSFDITKRRQSVTVSAKQCDEKTRSITAKLTQNGKPFKTPDGAEIKLCGTKPDSTIFELLPTESQENRFTFFLTDYALAAEGRIRCDVKCSFLEGNEPRICSTEIFYINNVAAAIIPGNTNVKTELESVERATLSAYGAAEVAAKTAEDILEAKRNGEFNGAKGDKGDKPQKGIDYFTESDKAEITAEVSAILTDDGIPDYWKNHIAQKTSEIKAHQRALGRDCFSFIVMTDLHYESNLAKLSPKIAKRIMDACGIKYVLCLGDVQTRHGANYKSDYIDTEWVAIEEMLSPIRNRLLITQGNHDGSYGIIDENGDNIADDINGDGLIDSYDKNVINYPPEELYERIFRKVGIVGDAAFSDDGRGYFIDDKSAKVRYILLNTHANKYEENEDRTAKYNNMQNFRFGQAQYDMVVEALSTIPSDNWSVIIASHVPLDRSGEYVFWGGTVDENGAQTGSPADCVIMQRLLNAYKNKTSYVGSFIGNQGEGKSYMNYADKGSTDWAEGSYINSSGAVASNSSNDVTNYIPAKAGDVVRIKNCNLYSSGRLAFYDADKKYLGILSLSTLTSGNAVTIDSETGITTYRNVAATTANGSPVESIKNCAYLRFVVNTASTSPIITVNEEISESIGRFYDAVDVNADFSEAKGDLIAYFGGHTHQDTVYTPAYSWNGAEHSNFHIITTRSDARTENTESLRNERVLGTITEQSFDVFTIDRRNKKIYATKIGAGINREISY